jgi:hypothetical protein
MRHMMNWAVGREYFDRTAFRRGTETLIRKQHEDNQRHRRLSEDEEIDLLGHALITTTERYEDQKLEAKGPRA